MELVEPELKVNDEYEHFIVDGVHFKRLKDLVILSTPSTHPNIFLSLLKEKDHDVFGIPYDIPNITEYMLQVLSKNNTKNHKIDDNDIKFASTDSLLDILTGYCYVNKQELTAKEIVIKEIVKNELKLRLARQNV